MSESLTLVPGASKIETYEALIPQIVAILEAETDLIANLANTAAALHHSLGFFWTGFYRVLQGQLILGPFQGPIACTRIAFQNGVCGAAYRQKQTIVVPDVEKFPGHIACSSASKSEIVVPVFKNGEVFLVLDVDSDKLDFFDDVDKKFLELLMHKLSERL